MFRVASFEPRHTVGALTTKAEVRYQPLLDNCCLPEDAWTFFYGDDVVGFGGTIVLQGKIGCWSLFTSKITPKSLLACFLFFRKHIAEYENDGFEVFFHIDPSYAEGVRWAGLLGFKPVGFEEVLGQTVQRYERWSPAQQS